MNRDIKITKEVRRYDRKLFAVRTCNGMLQIYREADHAAASDADEALSISRPHPQFILALTDTWTLKGKPVEWGMEPILAKLRDMDSWREDKILENMLKIRARNEEDELRSMKNTNRAMAADLRKDFAKATNDINTSTLSKENSNGTY